MPLTAEEWALQAEQSAIAASASEVVVLASEGNVIALEASSLVNADSATISANDAIISIDTVNLAVTDAQSAEANAVVAQSNAEIALASLLERYLGSLPSDPISVIEGALYWNSVDNVFKVWNGTSWEVTIVSAFNGIIEGGTADIPVDRLHLRSDTSINWTSYNPVLELTEVGLETDTTYLKFGDGTTAWNLLDYQQLHKDNLIGLENVDNTPDTDKPVSTLQEEADALVLTTAKEYTDNKILGLASERGDYSPAITNQFPIDTGSGIDGAILKGDTWNITSSSTLDTKPVKPGDSLKALVDNPTQNYFDWSILASVESVEKPYVVGFFNRGLVQANNLCIFHIFTTTVVFEALALKSNAEAKVGSATTTTFTIKKNEVSIGSIVFSAGNLIATITFTEARTFVTNDKLEIYSTNSDILLSDVTISLHGIR